MAEYTPPWQVEPAALRRREAAGRLRDVVGSRGVAILVGEVVVSRLQSST
ncbi:MAG: hypothetical protein FAZ92_03181 [Accumulibacter sp.]|nr:hypothetical protein [Accumulibacter sp.]QKS27677.1 MAG: hypothetical protein HT579_01055 [Candidatus Accumulibacter similis]TLD44506.1 MAG: hypothetical protein FAZ92_03181 [Accumulibacter sp.]